MEFTSRVALWLKWLRTSPAGNAATISGALYRYRRMV
jgi:hypothetical protein